MSDFERVTVTSPHREEPTLAVYPAGSGRLNTAAVEQWFEDVDTAQVFVDHESDRLGLAQVPEGAEGLTLTPDAEGATLSLRAALGGLGIDHDDISSATHLPLEHDPDEGLVIADVAPLREAVGDE
jgi:hypothetical protein